MDSDDTQTGIHVLGIDHIYVSVSDMTVSEPFYDGVMRALGFRKGDRPIAGQPHAHYFNRAVHYTLRPARDTGRSHDPYAAGLHHLCFQVASPGQVDRAYARLTALGVEAEIPALYPQYAEDYYATFFRDPDGIRLEAVARSEHRRQLESQWDKLRHWLNPLARAREGS